MDLAAKAATKEVACSRQEMEDKTMDLTSLSSTQGGPRSSREECASQDLALVSEFSLIVIYFIAER